MEHWLLEDFTVGILSAQSQLHPPFLRTYTELPKSVLGIPICMQCEERLEIQFAH
jgi:hypothetical protein